MLACTAFSNSSEPLLLALDANRSIYDAKIRTAVNYFPRIEIFSYRLSTGLRISFFNNEKYLLKISDSLLVLFCSGEAIMRCWVLVTDTSLLVMIINYHAQF
jgi:hypothetical protein